MLTPAITTYTNPASAGVAAAALSATLSDKLNTDVCVTFEEVEPGSWMLVIPALPVEPVLVCGDDGDGIENFDHPDASGFLDIDALLEPGWYDLACAYSREERIWMEQRSDLVLL